MFWPFKRKKKPTAPVMDTGAAQWLIRFLANAESFKSYNQGRIDQLRSQLPGARQKVFDLIPVLLHEDAMELVGNEAGNRCPSGLSCFSYKPLHAALLSDFFPNFKHNPRSKQALPITFLSVMGSAGTVAFSGESDIDFWVGLETRKQPPEAIRYLKQKLAAIEAWALEKAGLEVHFFITDLEDLRQERYGQIDGESCGTALAKLLKDEFYRTAVFIEGKAPYYWIVPPGTDDLTYREIIDQLEQRSDFPHARFADLGNISAISLSEYSGAALWQLLKGLDSPFKSVIKIGLLESYAETKQTLPPLCERYKRAVLDSKGQNAPDAYLFMTEAVREFYESRRLPDIRGLMEQCFLIKSFLTTGKASTDSLAVSRLRAIGSGWGLAPETLDALARFREWDYARSEALRRQTISYLVNTFKRIREATQASGSLMSERDAAVIGKKLHCFFEKRKGKAPFEFLLIDESMINGLVLEEEPVRGQDAPLWNVKIQVKGTRPTDLQAINTFDHPMAAVAFICANRLYSAGRQFLLKGRLKLSRGDAEYLLQSLNQFFPEPGPKAVQANDMIEAPRIQRLYVVPNWNHPDWNYGVASLFLVMQNSHGELLYEFPQGEKSVEWLKNTLLEVVVGRANFNRLTCSVHKPRERLSARLKISETLEKELNTFLAR